MVAPGPQPAGGRILQANDPGADHLHGRDSGEDLQRQCERRPAAAGGRRQLSPVRWWKLCTGGVRLLAALARHPELPRWARWGIVVAMLPIPGPFDELVGAAVVGGLLIRHRAVVTRTWAEVNSPSPPGDPADSPGW